MATKHRTGHLFKRGNNFYVRWVVEGKVFSKALRDQNGNAITLKREAEEAKHKLMAPFLVADEATALEAIAGRLEGRRAELAKLEERQGPPLPLTQVWSQYLASPNRPDSGAETLYGYECQWSAFADWLAQKHPGISELRQVSRSVAEEYATTLNHDKFSPNTYNKHLNLLMLVFRVLKDQAKLNANPWAELPRKRLITQSRRELTVDELRRICQSASGELRTLLGLGIYSGLRLGDCATLRWGETDLRRGIIMRIPNKLARRRARPVRIPIHPALHQILSEVPVESRGEYVLPEMAALYQHSSSALTAKIQAHFKCCGIQLYKPGTGTEGRRAVVEVGVHSLRHTFVSLCRESDAPLAVVESIVGHSSPAMTRHYTHIGELAAGRAVAALPSVLGKSLPPAANGPASEAMLREIRSCLEGMTSANWEAKRSEMLTWLPTTILVAADKANGAVALASETLPEAVGPVS